MAADAIPHVRTWADTRAAGSAAPDDLLLHCCCRRLCCCPAASHQLDPVQLLAQASLPAHSFFSTSSASLSASSSSPSLSLLATVPSSSALMALASSNFFANSWASAGG